MMRYDVEFRFWCGWRPIWLCCYAWVVILSHLAQAKAIRLTQFEDVLRPLATPAVCSRLRSLIICPSLSWYRGHENSILFRLIANPQSSAPSVTWIYVSSKVISQTDTSFAIKFIRAYYSHTPHWSSSIARYVTRSGDIVQDLIDHIVHLSERSLGWFGYPRVLARFWRC